jgi:putative YphP/YqiW family bacilliredoxin
MPYDPVLVQPMRDELTVVGIDELETAAAVDQFMADTTGSAMVVINSVCGCAAGSARPGIKMALRHEVTPDRVATVFAGQDLEATARARSYLPHIPPSSPSVALFRNGELVFMYPRHQIEGRPPQVIAADLVEAFDEHLSA